MGGGGGGGGGIKVAVTYPSFWLRSIIMCQRVCNSTSHLSVAIRQNNDCIRTHARVHTHTHTQRNTSFCLRSLCAKESAVSQRIHPIQDGNSLSHVNWTAAYNIKKIYKRKSTAYPPPPPTHTHTSNFAWGYLWTQILFGLETYPLSLSVCVSLSVCLFVCLSVRLSLL